MSIKGKLKSVENGTKRNLIITEMYGRMIMKINFKEANNRLYS